MQLKLRRQGNEHYKQKQFKSALEAYTRAKAMVDNLNGLDVEQSQEVARNLLATELNIAAVHYTEQHFGTAIKCCSKALAIDGQNVKALLRRAKAHIGRHNLEVNCACGPCLQRVCPTCLH